MSHYLNSLRFWFATATPEQQLRGRLWYHDAQAEAQRIADENDTTCERVCGVIAALSPMVTWEQNLIDAELLCAAHTIGADYDAVRARTPGKNKRKAWRILDGADIETTLLGNRGRGLKVTSFFHNMMYPDISDHVTVDRWVYRAAGFKDTPSWTTKTLYAELSDAIRSLADELNGDLTNETEFLLPCEVQAIIWTTIREAIDEVVDI